jgi:hypothetical protein
LRNTRADEGLAATAAGADTNGVEGIRYQRSLWMVTRFWEDADGLTDDAKEIASFWNQGEAAAEANRLNHSNTDPAVWYEVIEQRSVASIPPTRSHPGFGIPND